MKQSSAITLLLLGLACLLGSCAPFSLVIYNEFVVSPSQSHDFVIQDSKQEFRLHATPGSLARLALEAAITTPSVQEETDSLDQDYNARFRFPLNYSVEADDASRIVEEENLLAWKDGGMISTQDRDISSTGGTLTVTKQLETFTVPASGRFRARIDIGPDTTYQAHIDTLTLHLYEDVIDNASYIIAGLLLIVAALVLGAIGLLLIIVGAAKQGDGQALEIRSESSKIVIQQAIMIHLSALSGYVIPFGSLILPLVLWLLWRDRDPFLDKNGKEAVNFQISILLYYIISLLLVLVLIGLLLLVAVMVFQLVTIIVAAIYTSRGEEFRYPLTLRLIR